MTVECLVCCKPTVITHMGLDVCRACTVFYRRHGDKSDKFRCIAGTFACMDVGRGFYWCRKCRLDRIIKVVNAARGEEIIQPAIQNPTDSRDVKIEYVTTLLSNDSIIRRIRANHHLLSVLRLTSELELHGIELNQADATADNYEPIISTYQDMNDGTRVLIRGLFAFINSTFPEFQELREKERWLLIGKYEMIFHCIDSVLRLKKKFGNDSANFFFSYTSYMSHEFMERFFVNCPGNANVIEAKKKLHICFEEIVSGVRTLINQVNPTDDEFFALIGLAFWSIEALDVSDELISLASRYRTSIIGELTAHYRSTIGETNGACRIGSLICLVPDMKRLLTKLKTDFEMFHMLGAFDDNTLTYRLQML